MLRGESGISTVMMVMIGALVMSTVGSTIILLDKRKTYLEIVRMQTRLELTETQVMETATSLGALRVSGKKMGAGHPLYQCIETQNCVHMNFFQPYTLYDAGGRRVSGKRTLAGEPCDGECPLDIDTRFRISCGSGQSRCNQPAEVETRYSLRKDSKTYFGNRKFQDIEGTVSAATFVCPEDEYVTSISDDGQISCSGALGERFVSICPPGSAAYGMDARGLFKCAPVVDYCQEPIAFAYVIDTSGSMRRGKLDAAKTSSKSLLGNLETGDRASLTRYSSSAESIQSLTKNTNDVVSGLNQLKAKGFTNMTEGLRLGAQSLQGIAKDHPVMVFLSDGYHNRGDVDPVVEAQKVKDSGVRIFTVGYGKKPDEGRLQKIATAPADYFRAENASQLQKVLANISTIMCRE